VEFADPRPKERREQQQYIGADRGWDRLHGVQRPILFGAISLDLFAMLAGRHDGAAADFRPRRAPYRSGGLGFLLMAPAIGAAMVAIVLARWQLQPPYRHFDVRLLAIFGVGDDRVRPFTRVLLVHWPHWS